MGDMMAKKLQFQCEDCGDIFKGRAKIKSRRQCGQCGSRHVKLLSDDPIEEEIFSDLQDQNIEYSELEGITPENVPPEIKRKRPIPKGVRSGQPNLASGNLNHLQQGMDKQIAKSVNPLNKRAYLTRKDALSQTDQQLEELQEMRISEYKEKRLDMLLNKIGGGNGSQNNDENQRLRAELERQKDLTHQAQMDRLNDRITQMQNNNGNQPGIDPVNLALQMQSIFTSGIQMGQNQNQIDVESQLVNVVGDTSKVLLENQRETKRMFTKYMMEKHREKTQREKTRAPTQVPSEAAQDELEYLLEEELQGGYPPPQYPEEEYRQPPPRPKGFSMGTEKPQELPQEPEPLMEDEPEEVVEIRPHRTIRSGRTNGE